MSDPRDTLSNQLTEIFRTLMEQETMEKTILDVIPDIAAAIDELVVARAVSSGSRLVVPAGIPVEVDETGVGATTAEAVVEIE